MKITVEFNNLEETVDFSDFIKGRTAAPMAAPEAAQNVAVSTTMAGAAESAVSAASAGPGVVTQQPFTGVQQPQQTTAPQPAPAPSGGVPTAAPAYTLDDLAKAAQPVLDAGRHADLRALLQSFGVTSLPELQPGQYGAFATALRGMGAQI